MGLRSCIANRNTLPTKETVIMSDTTPYTCQFVAYVGHRIENRRMQCGREYGHPGTSNGGGGHYHGIHGLSDDCALRAADGTIVSPQFHWVSGPNIRLAREMGYLS